jgi:carbon-monoxide dehydrogenase medium subunit
VNHVPIRDFHLGPYETVVGPGELLTELRVPVRRRAGSAYEKAERRVGDWPVAAADDLLVLGDGTITEAGIGLTAVGAAHFAAPRAEEYLGGGRRNPTCWPRPPGSLPRAAPRTPTTPHRPT